MSPRLLCLSWHSSLFSSLITVKKTFVPTLADWLTDCYVRNLGRFINFLTAAINQNRLTPQWPPVGLLLSRLAIGVVLVFLHVLCEDDVFLQQDRRGLHHSDEQTEKFQCVITEISSVGSVKMLTRRCNPLNLPLFSPESPRCSEV